MDIGYIADIANTVVTKGASRNTNLSEFVGIMTSLSTNFNKSASGKPPELTKLTITKIYYDVNMQVQAKWISQQPAQKLLERQGVFKISSFSSAR